LTHIIFEIAVSEPDEAATAKFGFNY